MMRSLSSAVAGLRTHQTKMDVIGNNIANVNTYGFKSSRTSFADVYYQNLSGGRAGVTGARGGKNPTQIGYGSAVATVDVMINVSGSASTDRAMDVYIAGDGFLVTKDASGKVQYTRLGIMGFDASGNLIDGNGNLVQGFPMKKDGTPDISPDGTIIQDQLTSINVNPEILERLTSISISNNGTITGILPGETIIDPQSKNPDWINNSKITISENSPYSGSVRLAVSGYCQTPAMAAALGIVPATNVTSIEMGTVALPTATPWDVTVNSKGVVTMYNPGDPTNGIDPVTLTGSMDKNGKLVLADKGGNIGLTVYMDKNTIMPESAKDVDGNYTPKPLTLDLYYQMTTTDKGGNIVKVPAEPAKMPATWPASLSLEDITIGLDSSKYTTGQVFNGIVATAGPGKSETIVIGNLVLAKFSNSSGLQQSGTSYFNETLNSGSAVYVMPGIEGTGPLSAGYLEMSNVDVSKEFTDMITTQRGFQANTRIITVSDEMLQELVNLKR